MKTYTRVIVEENEDIPESEVFKMFVKEINHWHQTNEIDFMITSDTPGYITRFSSMNTGDIGHNNLQVIRDAACLEVNEFWDKYEDKLKGKWHNNKRIILY
jgi:hypothetical protein